MKLDLNLGTQVYCQDKPCGWLANAVIDAATHQVTALVVKRGLLRKQEWLVPFSVVHSARGNALRLNLHSVNLSHYLADRQNKQETPTNPVSQQLRLVSAEQDSMSVPLMHSCGAGGKVVVGHQTLVVSCSGTLGYAEQLLLDTPSGQLTHVLIRRGILTTELVIPDEQIVEMSDTCIVVTDGSYGALANLPHDRVHDVAETVAAVEAHLQAAWPAFAEVTVTWEADRLRLTGCVRSKALCRHATELALLVPGVLIVDNALVVDPALLSRQQPEPRADIAAQVS
jgi:hypothetical protein